MRGGVLDYVSGYVGGACFNPFPYLIHVKDRSGAHKNTYGWGWQACYSNDPFKLCIGIQPGFSQCEFQYYRRDIADKIFDVLKGIDYEIHSYPREEIYLCTLLRHFGEGLPISKPYGVVFFDRLVEQADVDDIRSIGHPRWPSNCFPDAQNVFAVKRIVRDFDDPIRAYIRKLHA